MHTLQRIFLTGASLLVLCTGCGKSGGEDAVDGASRITVSFVTLPVQTKAGAVSDAGEVAVNSLDLLAFRSESGLLDCYAHAAGSGTTTVNARLTAGESLDWYLVANAPASANLASFSTRSAFLAAKTLLQQTTSTSMVMHASGTSVFVSNPPGTPIEVDGIELTRYVSKVSVNSIAVEWLNDFDTAPSCTLVRAILVNARGDCAWSGTPSALAGDLWYNCSEDTTPEGFVGSLLSWSGSVTLNATGVNTNVHLFTMPNSSVGNEKAGNIPWAPRRTRMCLCLSIGGVQQWYPIDLPSMQGNSHYVVTDLTIKGPGTASPDMGVDRTSVTFTVSIAPWDENLIDDIEFPKE